jgi:hypothetical protein
MTLKTISGYRNTEEANQFTSAIESRVSGGQAFARENAPQKQAPAAKGNTL